jgi:preprotein translocase subunit SecE
MWITILVVLVVAIILSICIGVVVAWLMRDI